METEQNGGFSNYDAGTMSLSKRFSHGLQFQGSYTFARNLSTNGYNPTAFATEAGGQVQDLNNIGLDYGNVPYTRRNRFLVTFLYQRPFDPAPPPLPPLHPVVDPLSATPTRPAAP